MDRLKAQTEAAQLEKQRNEAKMRQPANAEVLDRSRFLNELFLRKSFSWTAVMMDLETVLPIGVQITSIEPQISTEGDVVIRLRVSGERDKAVQLVRNLERSKRFLLPRLSTEAQQAKQANGAQVAPGATPGVEFEVLANYNPIPADAPLVTKASVKSAGVKAAPKAPGAPRHRGDKPATDQPAITLKPYVKPTVTPRPTPKGGA
jgi:type IV pilus assembly protein PilN